MARPLISTTILFVCVTIAACNQDKPKPSSNDINKTTINVKGEKDSVINNPKDNYGNATIAGPCVECMVKLVQADSHFKQLAGNIAQKDVLYVANWVKADGLPDSLNNSKATNGLRLDVIDKKAANKKVVSYIYDNSIAKLYLVTDFTNYSKIEVKADAMLLKKIRNACYWGVASSK